MQGLKGKGDWFDLVGDSGRVWGRAVLTGKDTANPVFVSVGHKISIATATELTLAMSHHRIPEPVRQVKSQSAGWAGYCQLGGGALCACECVCLCVCACVSEHAVRHSTMSPFNIVQADIMSRKVLRDTAPKHEQLQ